MLPNETEPSGRPSAVTVLVVDDEDSARALCAEVARDAGLYVRAAPTTERALEILEQYPIDIVVTDLKVPDLGGLELLKRIRALFPHVDVVMLTQYGTIENAVEATRLGAADYVTKPFHVEELRSKLERLVRGIELDQENRVLREQLRSRPGGPGAPRIGSARVLVVEDEPTVAQLVSDVLTEEGHQVESVLDSQEGLARALRQPYDLVICDLKMPRLDGRAFFEALARAGARARQRILFITGDTLGPRTLEFLETTRLPYLGKPFLVEELKAMVGHILETASASPAESELVATPPPGSRREVVRKR